ncbi:hypothetical protein HY968_03170 [Candidatus Kaiserbacteria bacterium]|nr:hypothetical protein [Candidatus Kaiserbacteria bacterium]
MLNFFHGSDREKARETLNTALTKTSKKKQIVRITDAHTIADLQTTLQGPGMFAEARVIVLDGIVGGENDEMRTMIFDSLQTVRDSDEVFFMLEGALDAATRKQIEKYAEKSEKFDAAKSAGGGSAFGGKENTIFALANALERGDKKALWVGYQRELVKGSAPEAIHGILFWGAKRMFMNSRSRSRASSFVARLAELPHEARRRGEEMQYALERFILSGSSGA